MRHLFPTFALCAIALTLSAQTRPGAAPPPSKTPAPVAPATAASPATLTGIVFDSLSMKPLAGATVVVSGSNVQATTDAKGHYAMSVDSIGEGSHTFSFFHPVFDSLGISPPPRTMVLQRGTPAVLDLAMPSAATIVASVCPDSMSTEGRGLILGEVRDADADKPLDSAIVVVMWTDLQVGTDKISKLPRAVSARSDARGIYRVCGVKPNTQLRLQARKLPKASGWLELAIPPSGVIVQPLFIGERPATSVRAGPQTTTVDPSAIAIGAGSAAAAKPAGTALLSGTVVGGDGTPLEGAQIMLLGTSMSARSDARGNFRMKDLPSGTQEVEVRLLSYQPKQYTVNLAARRESKLNAVLDQRAQVLDPVVVNARKTSDIPGYDERKKTGMGTYFDHEQVMQNSVASISDVFRRVPGMQVLYVDGNYSVVSARGAVADGCKSANLFVDGVKFELVNENFDDIVLPVQVAAIEVYVSAVDTPAQYQQGQVRCGTILIWTETGHFKKKGQPADTTS